MQDEDIPLSPQAFEGVRYDDFLTLPRARKRCFVLVDTLQFIEATLLEGGIVRESYQVETYAPDTLQAPWLN